uniref:Uncharacterized protein n=1 Tax=Avena sativa TaxID=4498 RepID=A0ACD5WIA9_AVESA
MDRRPELQPRTRTLWEQLTTPDPAIRDFLKIPHDDDGATGDADRRTCTLMDAIGRESRGESAGRGTISWKPRLRDRLRLRRDANVRSAATSDRSAVFDGSEEEEEESKDEAPPPDSVSLMALMEQADNHWDDDDDEDEEQSGASASDSGAVAGGDEEDGEGRHEQDEEEETARACCVCMVRHKGAAFIPCGHTFCRLCSRDLWLARASCPLCNAFIHDVLHIF